MKGSQIDADLPSVDGKEWTCSATTYGTGSTEGWSTKGVNDREEAEEYRVGCKGVLFTIKAQILYDLGIRPRRRDQIHRHPQQRKLGPHRPCSGVVRAESGLCQGDTSAVVPLLALRYRPARASMWLIVEKNEHGRCPVPLHRVQPPACYP